MAWNEGIDHNEIFSKGNDNWKDVFRKFVYFQIKSVAY